MSAPQTIEIVKLGDSRIFIQEDGPNPFSKYNYAGVTSLGGPTESLGDLTPIYAPSRTQRNKWDIIDTAVGSPSLPTTDFTAYSSKYLDDIWWELKRTGCFVNIQVVIGDCTRPDDFNAWVSKILLSFARLTSFTLSEFGTLSGDNNGVSEITGSLTLRGLIPIKQLRFEEQADTTVTTEILDGIYNDAIDCGTCGTASDGCNKAYTLAAASTGSPGLSAHVIWTTDGWATDNSVDISSLGGLTASRIAAVGDRIVVISEADAAHHHIRISSLSNAAAWQRVATGYEVGGSPRCIHAANSQEVYIGGAGGYIYLMTNPTTGVTALTDGSLTTENVNDIRAYGNVVIAACDNNKILLSINRGETFTLLDGPLPGQNLNTVDITTEYIVYVGTGNGQVYASDDQALTWSAITPDGDLTVINRIRFYDENVGAMATQVAGGVRVYRTDDMGNTWTYQKPSVAGLPDAERYNFVALCDHNDILTGGRQTPGGDGILALAR